MGDVVGPMQFPLWIINIHLPKAVSTNHPREQILTFINEPHPDYMCACENCIVTLIFKEN